MAKIIKPIVRIIAPRSREFVRAMEKLSSKRFCSPGEQSTPAKKEITDILEDAGIRDANHFVLHAHRSYCSNPYYLTAMYDGTFALSGGWKAGYEIGLVMLAGGVSTYIDAKQRRGKLPKRVTGIVLYPQGYEKLKKALVRFVRPLTRDYRLEEVRV